MIKVKIDEIREELNSFEAALGIFENYSSDFIKNVSDEINNMNSDFTNKIVKVLDNMKDTKAPELFKRLEKFYDSANYVVDSFEDVDKRASEDIKLREGEN